MPYSRRVSARVSKTERDIKWDGFPCSQGIHIIQILAVYRVCHLSQLSVARTWLLSALFLGICNVISQNWPAQRRRHKRRPLYCALPAGDRAGSKFLSVCAPPLLTHTLGIRLISEINLLFPSGGEEVGGLPAHPLSTSHLFSSSLCSLSVRSPGSVTRTCTSWPWEATPSPPTRGSLPTTSRMRAGKGCSCHTAYVVAITVAEVAHDFADVGHGCCYQLLLSSRRRISFVFRKALSVVKVLN